MQNKNAEKIFFDKISSVRNEYPINDKKVVTRIVNYVHNTLKHEDKSASLVLDAGCGTGQFGKELAKLGYKVIGLDISPKAVLVANSVSVTNFKAIEGDIENQNLFQKMSLDAILCCSVLHHIPNIKNSSVLNNFRCWLKLGGFVFIWEPNGSNPITKFLDFLRKVKIDKLDEFATLNEVRHSFHIYKKNFEKMGFTMVSATTMTDKGIAPLPIFLEVLTSVKEFLFFISKILPFPYNNSALFMIFKLKESFH